MKSLDRVMIANFAGAIWITQMGLYLNEIFVVVIGTGVLLFGLILGWISEVKEKREAKP